MRQSMQTRLPDLIVAQVQQTELDHGVGVHDSLQAGRRDAVATGSQVVQGAQDGHQLGEAFVAQLAVLELQRPQREVVLLVLRHPDDHVRTAHRAQLVVGEVQGPQVRRKGHQVQKRGLGVGRECTRRKRQVRETYAEALCNDAEALVAHGIIAKAHNLQVLRLRGAVVQEVVDGLVCEAHVLQEQCEHPAVLDGAAYMVNALLVEAVT
mmetsp:Transcript_73907/g.216871  ORF Transcript_73907/g.216871 Transcript_73907/m.216871 type:complete len:209 (+) Transcript_73907:268-894(+)